MRFSIFFVIVQFSFIALSCQTSEKTNEIRLNQIGYYPGSIKSFILTDEQADSFTIIDEDDNEVFNGDLINRGIWDQSGEQIMIGDFTELKQPGTYRIKIKGLQPSHKFEIKDHIYQDALNASIKSYYFQRASMAIDEKYGGEYKRAAGIMDNACPYHPSTGKENGQLNSPGGWFDAGDYGKYIVNAAVSVGQMLNLVEIHPGIISDGQLNIPESGNGKSDLLDELKYELDWMLTMQDTDGGVFHKLTALNFSGFIMPADYSLERLIIGKGTAATLDFAAVMAQSYRMYRSTDSLFAVQCLQASEKAWKWAYKNNNVPFVNPPDVKTGEYGDDDFYDEFFWAAAELYISTGESSYLDYLVNHMPEYVHKLTNSWKFFVRNIGFHSLLANQENIEPELGNSIRNKHLVLSDKILLKIDAIPYQIGLDLFEWGSNSDVLNQAMILGFAHYLTKDQKYLDGMIRSIDYIFGKNAVGYSFLTGYGTKQPMFPHHRPSGADGIVLPIPGFIVGGPNKDKQDRFSVNYSFYEPARSYEDVESSYASNEVCINWNAPAVFVLGYLESIQ